MKGTQVSSTTTSAADQQGGGGHCATAGGVERKRRGGRCGDRRRALETKGEREAGDAVSVASC